MIVHPGRTVEVEASISTQPIALDPIEVVAVRSPFLEQAGFYDRAERMAAWGSQFGYRDIEAMNPMFTTDILRRATGISVQGGQALSNRLSGSGGQGCVLGVYLDGVRMDGLDMDAIPPDFIEAVEVYQGLGMPIEYMGNECGVVLVWTRRGR
jgi:hypothetical protein